MGNSLKFTLKDLVLDLLKYLNVALITLPLAICWVQYYAPRIYIPFYFKGIVAVIIVFVLLYGLFSHVYGGLHVSTKHKHEIFYEQTLAILMSDTIMFIVVWLLTRHFPNILPALLTLATQLAISLVWSVLTHVWYFAVFPPKRSAIIYDERQGMEELIREYGLAKKFDLQLTCEVHSCIKQLEMLEGFEYVFLSGIHSKERNIILKYCIANGVRVYVVPGVGDVVMSGAKTVHLFHLPMLQVKQYDPPLTYLAIKRAIDILLSGVAVIVTSPIMLITAALIKANDGGPVFYKQCRLTKGGKTFDVLKFRSMRIDAEKDGVARLSTGDNDDRITPVGRVIRKLRIDELPQLLNILRGDMSIVGPRPERPEIAEQYMQDLPEFSLRLQAKAGLTGYAQVYGKYNTAPYDKLLMDLLYISKPSIINDLQIILATIKILFIPDSTEGVAVGQVTADAKSGKDPDDTNE